jgi:hypothetical protein
MKHLIAFQKRKGLYIKNGSHNNANLVHQIAHEMMSKGFVLSKVLFDALSTRSEKDLNKVHNQLCKFIERVVGGAGYEPIYRNFPQSVTAMSQFEFVINAIGHYWSGGNWRPEDSEYINREFALETVNFTELSLLTKDEYNSIFTEILFSGTSISKFDKEILEWAIGKGKFEVTAKTMGKISFNETKAFVGKLLFNSKLDRLPTKDATLVLRMYSAYCGGDEGLKENTRFKNPNAHQRKMILNTLEDAYNLEEAFKINREKWLRVLYYLHPLTKTNKGLYPNVANWADKLRNNPKSMKTFNAKVEDLINMKDASVFELLVKRPGVFTRRIDHMVRIFGYTAFEKWLTLDLNMDKLVTAYNHFITRDEVKDRGAVLASQSSSKVVTYEALAALDSRLVKKITDAIMDRLKAFKTDPKKVYIDRSLYYTPLATNNRASSLSIAGKALGMTEIVPKDKTLRIYCHWDKRHDIDLSGLMIDKNNNVIKVGWNAHHHANGALIYSGDNTGHSSKNAEYLDIVPNKLDSSIEWIIVEARIYSGPRSFKDWDGNVRMGWMERNKPEANTAWLPETIEHAVKIETDAKNAFLMAYHVETSNVVYLDVAMDGSRVSSAADGIKMRTYLESFVQLDTGSDEINWKTLNQGHIINLLNDVVDSPEEADVVYDENTTSEKVSALVTA